MPAELIDFRPLILGAARRPTRKRTRAIVIHRYDVAEVNRIMASRGMLVGSDPFEAMRVFWTEYPEGVARATVQASMVPHVAKLWHRRGVPVESLAAAFVPYHFAVDEHGRVAQFLDVDAVGAHTYGRNSDGIGVALVGPLLVTPPPAAQLLAAKQLTSRMLALYPDAIIEGHDDVRARQGKKPKPCPGPFVDVAAIRSWAELRAAEVREGPSRR